MVKFIPNWLSISVVCLSVGLAGCQHNAPKTQSDAASYMISDAESYFKNRQYEKAMELYRPLAERGDPRAQYAIGYMYYYGKGVRSDEAQSSHWIELAADQKYAPAVAAKKSMHAHKSEHNSERVHQQAMNPPEKFVPDHQQALLMPNKLDAAHQQAMKESTKVYGPTSEKDSLWSIANQLRKDPSVSSQQMMVAIVRANPRAFHNKNANGIKMGQMLRVPDESEVAQISKEDALREIERMDADWRQ